MRVSYHVSYSINQDGRKVNFARTLMAKVTLTVEADDVSDLQETLRRFTDALEQSEEEPSVGEEELTEEDIVAIWGKLKDDARFVLGIIADGVLDDNIVSRTYLFGELPKYTQYGATVKQGVGFGGTLSSYGFATRSLGLRGKKEKLYLSDESGYSMKRGHAEMVNRLFVDFLESKKP